MLSKYLKVPRRENLIFIAFIAGLIGLSALTAKKYNPTTPPDGVVTYSSRTPSQEPTDNYHWQGNADEPKYINLPTIHSAGFIQKVGVDQNHQVAAPNNIHLAGWYVDSEKPSRPGLSVIDGHTGLPIPAIFRDLGKLKTGDHFSVELGDGSKRQYRIMSVHLVSASKAVDDLFSQSPDVKSQLNLITCAGNFDAPNQTFDQRVVVAAAYQP